MGHFFLYLDESVYSSMLNHLIQESCQPVRLWKVRLFAKFAPLVLKRIFCLNRLLAKVILSFVVFEGILAFISK